jgi:hypothetical protein
MFGLNLGLDTFNPFKTGSDLGIDGLWGTERGTNTATKAPWGPQQPYLTRGFERAEGTYNQAQSSPFASLLKSRAQTGTPLTSAGMNLATNTLRGDYLNPQSNPFFSGALSQAMDTARSKINSQFQGNNYGSSAHQEWLSKGMMGAASPLLASMYQSGLDNQNRVLGMSPALANQDLELMAQAENIPWANLQRYMTAVGGDYGGVSETPYYVNNTANTLGALSGLGMAYMGMKR